MLEVAAAFAVVEGNIGGRLMIDESVDTVELMMLGETVSVTVTTDALAVTVITEAL